MLNAQLLKSNTKVMLAVLLALAVMVNITHANADERESLEQLKATTTNLIDLLVQEGVLPKDKADAMMKKASQDAAQQVKQAKAKEADLVSNGESISQEKIAQDDKSVRVQYVPEHVKKEMRDEIQKEVMTKLNYKAGTRLGLPSWIDRIAFNGDMRLRYENDSFSSNNAPATVLNNTVRNANISNSTEDRNRFRLRARLGADLEVNDWLKGGLRLTTGTLTDPVSPNQTEEIGKGKYTIGLDRAYLAASPLPWLSVQGGRFSNPFLHTDLVWDPDLAFDGVAATFTPKLNDTWSSFTTVGAFPIEEIQSSEVNKAKDKWLYALQTGIKWQAQNRSTAKLGIAYYDYQNVEGISNPTGLDTFSGTVPAFRQKGNNTFNINTLNGGLSGANNVALASQFELINLTGQISLLTFDPVHVTLTGDYVKNIGFDANEIFRRTGNNYKEENEGYQMRLDVGHNSFNGGASTEVKPNDWQVSLAYKRLEADSVVDAFTDSDFHLGGTDAKGWLIGGNYAVDKNAWVSARYFSADAISGLPLSIDVLLIDFIAKF
jgi:Putative porin